MEFALAFPILLGVTYAIVVYSFLFIVSQSLNFAAQEAAEAAVAVDPAQSTAEYQAEVVSLVNATVASNVNWMVESTRQLVQTPEVIFCSDGSDASCPASADNSAVVVRIRMTSDPSNPLFATFNLYPFGTFPPLPTLSAVAVARL